MLILLCSFLSSGKSSLLFGQRCAYAAQNIPQDPDQQYKTAKAYFLRLEQNENLRKERGNWLNGAQTFQKISLSQKKEVLGPPSLFMAAKMYQRMFYHFNQFDDLDKSIEEYLQVADLYPGNSLADDALYAAAEGLQLRKGKEEQVTALYQKIVSFYPKSDHFDKALANLSSVEKAGQPVTTILGSPSSGPKDLSTVFPLKYWSSQAYSRIVIPFSSPVTYTSGLLEKDDEHPHRLYVNFSRSFVAPKFRAPLLLQDGLLKQIQTAQSSDDSVRMVIDLASMAEYKVFSLNDPFRIIVDISASPSGGTSTPAAVIPAVVSRPSVSVANDLVSDAKGKDKKPIISLSDQKKRSPNFDGNRNASADKTKISLAQQLGLGVRKIVVDPGHGGKDPGAMAFGLKEKDIVLNISKKITRILKAVYHYEVILTRNKDEYISLEERTAIANTHKSDLFISIHVNAHVDKTRGGIETYFLNLATDANAMQVAALENATSTHGIGEMQDILANIMKNSKLAESSRLAQFVQTNLISGLISQYNTRDLGVKQAPFFVLIGAQMPAILAEISFITNPDEAKLLQSEPYQEKIAAQIAAGIVAYIDHHHTAAVRL